MPMSVIFFLFFFPIYTTAGIHWQEVTMTIRHYDLTFVVDIIVDRVPAFLFLSY